MANALRDLTRIDEAVNACRRALELAPQLPEAHHNLAAALADQGCLQEAAECYRRAIRLRPDFAAAWNNLGIVLKNQGLFEEAVAAYRRALELQPEAPEFLNNLGNALRHQGEPAQAMECYRRAIQLRPGYAEAYNNLGLAFAEMGRLAEAIAAFRQAVALSPSFAKAHNNLGIGLALQGSLDEAMLCYERALALAPSSAEVHINIGNALRDQARPEEAVAAYRRAVQGQPENPAARSNVIYSMEFLPGADHAAIAAEWAAWNRHFSDPLRRSFRPHGNSRDPDRRLRVGYVSADFRDHVVGRNLVPLFQGHHGDQFEIFCYSGVRGPDALTARIRDRCPQWRDTIGVGDDALAEMIREDRVDILVDLSQHMAGNRLPVFARRPAPVQVSFAGYPSGTGLDAIPYRISDRYLENSLLQSGRDEAPGIPDPERMATPDAASPPPQVFLLDSFWCYDPCGIDLPVNALPALQSGHITFGCLNNFCKSNDAVLELWARVLRQVSGSRLLLLTSPGSHRTRTLQFFERQGVAADRVVFLEPRERPAYLTLYHQVDVALDPFPYNGHTTSLDALWMGVPVVSLAGDCTVSRAGFSQLSNVGLQELCALNVDDYVSYAEYITGDITRLAQIRSGLRQRLAASPIMDAPRFVHLVEAAFRSMWRLWCRSPHSQPA